MQPTDTNPDKKDLKTIFNSFDLDKNGTIQLKQLGKIATELGEKISEQQLKDIVQLLDVNQDGRISFEQFQYWWIKGKKGKLMRLVQLKAKALKLTNFIKNKFKTANISIEDHKGSEKPDIFDFSIQFGQKCNDGINISSNFYIQGQKQSQLLSQIKCFASEISQKTVGVIIKLPSDNPAHAKTTFDLILNDLISSQNFPIPIQLLAQNQFFTYSSQVLQKCLLIKIFLNQELVQVGHPLMSGADAVISKMGQSFYALNNFQVNINASIDDILDKSIIDCLLKGFSAKFYTEANRSSLHKLRKLAQKQDKEMPVFLNIGTLIKASKFHWKLKTPEQVQKFLKKMGILQTINDIPIIADILQQKGSQMNKDINQNMQLLFLRKLTKFALKHINNNIQIYHMDGQAGCGKIQIKAKNITRIHSIIFNQF